jgi:hypothetical protein
MKHMPHYESFLFADPCDAVTGHHLRTRRRGAVRCAITTSSTKDFLAIGDGTGENALEVCLVLTLSRSRATRSFTPTDLPTCWCTWLVAEDSSTLRSVPMPQGAFVLIEVPVKRTMRAVILNHELTWDPIQPLA